LKIGPPEEHKDTPGRSQDGHLLPNPFAWKLASGRWAWQALNHPITAGYDGF
jgi:hypothetical protein